MLVECLLAVLLVLVFGIIMYARWPYGSLEALGIPVVKPSFMLGSLPDLHKRVIHEEDIRFYKELGPVFGVSLLSSLLFFIFILNHRLKDIMGLC